MINLVLAILRAEQVVRRPGQRHPRPAARARAGRGRSRRRAPRTGRGAGPPAGRRRRRRGLGRPTRSTGIVARRTWGSRTPTAAASLGSPAPMSCRGCAATGDEIGCGAARARRWIRPGRPVRLAAARAGQRAADRAQLLLRRPEGDPVRARLPDRPGDGRVAAGRGTSPRPAAIRSRSACRCGVRRRCGPVGDDIAEVLALLGVLPVWDQASRRVVGLEPVPLAELGRPRIDVTVRISGFFRDAFPHVVAMLDDAVRLVAGLDEPADQNYVRAHAAGRSGRARRRSPGDDPGLRVQAGLVRGRASCR